MTIVNVSTWYMCNRFDNRMRLYARLKWGNFTFYVYFTSRRRRGCKHEISLHIRKRWQFHSYSFYQSIYFIIQLLSKWRVSLKTTIRNNFKKSNQFDAITVFEKFYDWFLLITRNETSVNALCCIVIVSFTK